MKTYRHSKVFAQFKAIKEDIQENLTSLEYLQILDFLFKKAWIPIVAYYPFFCRNFVAKTFAYQVSHPYGKVSSDEKDMLSVTVAKFLTEDDKKKRIEEFKNLHFNRSIIAGMVSAFLSLGKEYTNLWSPFNDKIDSQEKAKKTVDILNNLGISQSEDARLYLVCSSSAYWLDKALDFRSKIIEKYVRMSLLQAQRAYEEFNHQIDLDDISSIYVATVGKAVDRCDSRLGVLTTFIQNWLQSARSEVQSMAKAVGNTSSYEELMEENNNMSIAEDTVNDTETYISVQDIAYKAKQVDADGCLRFTLNIPEVLTLEQESELKKWI